MTRAQVNKLACTIEGIAEKVRNDPQFAHDVIDLSKNGSRKGDSSEMEELHGRLDAYENEMEQLRGKGDSTEMEELRSRMNAYDIEMEELRGRSKLMQECVLQLETMLEKETAKTDSLRTDFTAERQKLGQRISEMTVSAALKRKRLDVMDKRIGAMDNHIIALEKQQKKQAISIDAIVEKYRYSQKEKEQLVPGPRVCPMPRATYGGSMAVTPRAPQLMPRSVQRSTEEMEVIDLTAVY